MIAMGLPLLRFGVCCAFVLPLLRFGVHVRLVSLTSPHDPLQECQISQLIVLIRIVQSLLLSCFEWSFSESPRIRISSLVKPLLAHEGLSTFWRSVV